ncbi:MAG: hypothetical protein V2A54_10265 [Bacteroidota bacterium]
MPKELTLGKLRAICDDNAQVNKSKGRENNLKILVEKHNENFEEFIRKSIEGYDCPYDKTAWDQMNKIINHKKSVLFFFKAFFYLNN